MPLMTPEELAALVAALDSCDAETLDELLHDLLVVPYPTRETQDD